METQIPAADGPPPAHLTGRQARVHAMIMSVGGYWAPVNAVARLLEELAEVGELLPAGPPGDCPPELAGELADLWIITTVLASQFNLTVPDPGPDGDPAVGFAGLVGAAGQVARVVNYYDGPKHPRSPGELPTLATALALFQAALAGLAARYGADLAAAVDAKVAEAASRDRGRFPLTPDPATAAAVAAFTAACPAGRLLLPGGGAGLWGAPPWADGRSFAHNLDLVVPFLTRFAKAAGPEGLPGFVIELPGGLADGDPDALGKGLAGLLTGLAARDPRPDATFAGDVTTPGCRFSFHGAPLSVAVFSPLYAEPDPRHSRQGAFVLLRTAGRAGPGQPGEDALNGQEAP
jgi:hypothetical protein